MNKNLIPIIFAAVAVLIDQLPNILQQLFPNAEPTLIEKLNQLLQQLIELILQQIQTVSL